MLSMTKAILDGAHRCDETPRTLPAMSSMSRVPAKESLIVPLRLARLPPEATTFHVLLPPPSGVTVMAASAPEIVKSPSRSGSSPPR